MIRQPSPIFIVGTERSGSNLLRLILNEHPSIAIPHPPHILKEMMPLEPLYGDLTDDANFRRLVGDVAALVERHFSPWDARLDREALFREAPERGVYGVKAAAYDQYRRAKGKPRWGCKSTFVIHYVDRVRRTHPAAQFVHLVRDGRDVAASAKRSVFNDFHPHYVARRWAAEQRIALGLARALPPERFLSVRYEDLLDDPPAVVRRVCGFLGEDYSDRLLEYFRGADARALAGLSRSWENVSRPVIRENRSRYKTALAPGEVRAFEVQAFAELGRYGYPLENDRASLTEEASRGLSATTRLRYWALDAAWGAWVGAKALLADRNELRRLRKKLFVRWLGVSRRFGPGRAAIAAVLLAAAFLPQPASAAAPSATVAAAEPAAGDAAAPVPRRARRRPRYKHLVKRRPAGPVARLKGEHWTPEVRGALERLLAAKGRGAPGYDPEWPPVAVLALDDVSVVHHPGETAFQRLVERAEFKFTREWWAAVPPAYREIARRSRRQFLQQGEAVWPNDPDYQAWRKAMFAAYDDSCREEGPRRCRAWLARMLAGFTEAEAEAYMRDAIEDALREPLATTPVLGAAGDPRPVQVRRGLRRIPEIAELARELLDRGFDVWMLSSSNQWAAEAVAKGYGIDPTRVVGVRVRVLNKRLRAEALDPVPEGIGMAEAVTASIGREPALALGGPREEDLLAYGAGLRIALDPGDVPFAARARARGWLTQPPLPAGAAETAP